MDWRDALDELDRGVLAVVGTLERLSDEDMRAPSALPGWSRGHVATHIARNAESLWNLLEWARTGVEIPQYPSIDTRNADLDAGAGRGRAELVEDVMATAARFSEQARTLPEDAWNAPVRSMMGWWHPAWYSVYRRWNEVEAHHVDLAAGYGRPTGRSPTSGGPRRRRWRTWRRCRRSCSAGWPGTGSPRPTPGSPPTSAGRPAGRRRPGRGGPCWAG
ncbi:maleylpyruvate isomerase N-terminal domain-containing protein [Actinomadura madurae]|uniref:maleylpyruvate isomerase N-terminal domain-containing protein n=1 Tax=Actinomadura madurae TaxID=1993 RepID=UPI0020D24D1F|nr:maleylpyruvate isomerase family mycothiol-dependent enzyme [Actinomadura madurae]MCP9964761.1 maleylpyruvate isomerase family mycothiol-dependent enzyme [Actinomadura madurae]MCQ0011255.1 maleylpyruvate isomerase family mycothiol-dependent enzyme [Actinomadura madurae]MCQ0013424.1 maleylpyruvate isomerase family mycothiol-dependent enzyme [Actinomadura madurae]